MEWPSGIGAKGNEGVAGNVKQTQGAIGYVEYAYAKQNKLTYTKLVNKAGKTVDATNEAFQAAAANADWTSAPGYYLILTDQPGDKSWPITAATYMLMRADYPQAKNKSVVKFLDWAMKSGQDDAKKLDYVPMPDNVIKLIEASWSKTLKAQP